MIKSKFGVIGYFSLFFEAFFFFVTFVLTVDAVSGYFWGFKIIFRKQADKDLGFLIILFFLAFTVTLIRVLEMLKFINIDYIDIDRKVINLRNMLSGKQQSFLISDIDGYYDAVIRNGGGSSRELLLVQNNRVISIVSEDYFANYKELAAVLKEVNYLGTLEYDFQEKIRMLLNRSI